MERLHDKKSREQKEREDRARRDRRDQEERQRRQIAEQQQRTRDKEAQRRRERERADDQRRQDQIERHRREDAARDRQELERHHRAIEARREREQPQRAAPFTPETRARSSYSDYREISRKRRSGWWIVLFTLLVVGWRAWPSLRDVVENVRSVAGRAAASSLSHADAPAAASKRRVAVKPHRKVAKLPYYPPCSASVTDHCRELP